MTVGLSRSALSVGLDRLRAGDSRLSGRAGRPPCRAATARMTADQVLEWNQIFIDTLIATNTANSSSQRLGAIVHTAIFDAYNGIERRYTPIFVHPKAPHGASRRAAVIAAAYTALVGLFPSQTGGARCQLCGFARGAERRCERQRSRGRQSCAAIERGIAWGTEVAQAVLAWRATDGFSASLPSVHRWDRGWPVAADTAGVRTR